MCTGFGRHFAVGHGAGSLPQGTGSLVPWDVLTCYFEEAVKGKRRMIKDPTSRILRAYA